MPSRLDDLFPDDGLPAVTEDVRLFQEECQDLLNDPLYRFAWDTIAGIRDTVSQKGFVTEKQHTAIHNIREGGRKHDAEKEAARYGRRRYEGYPSGRRRY